MNCDNNNKNWLLNCLLVLMLLACARGEALGAPGRQELQEMRTLATVTTTNVLLYYNVNGIPYEADNIEAFTHNLNRLGELSTQTGDAALTEQIRRLVAAVSDLKNLPQNKASVRSVLPAYQLWLPSLIEAHLNLDKLLSERYERAPEVAQVQGLLHGLSHDVGRMLLSSQMASFPNFGGVLWILDEQALAVLDADIERRFAELPGLDSDLATVLKVSLRDYRFVRQHLLNPYGNWAPNAVALYLVKTLSALDSEGRRLGGDQSR